jgi:hypothetical protein
VTSRSSRQKGYWNDERSMGVAAKQMVAPSSCRGEFARRRRGGVRTLTQCAGLPHHSMPKPMAVLPGLPFIGLRRSALGGESAVP